MPGCQDDGGSWQNKGLVGLVADFGWDTRSYNMFHVRGGVDPCGLFFGRAGEPRCSEGAMKTKVSRSRTLSKMTLDSHAIHGTIVYIYLLPIYIYIYMYE